jgi:hypothetical protein
MWCGTTIVATQYRRAGLERERAREMERAEGSSRCKLSSFRRLTFDRLKPANFRELT